MVAYQLIEIGKQKSKLNIYIKVLCLLDAHNGEKYLQTGK